jgi:hypothetical protein
MGMNQTPEAKRERARYLAEARRTGDAFTVRMLEADLVDFDPPVNKPYKPEICGVCKTEIAAMVGCYCDWGDGEDPV